MGEWKGPSLKYCGKHFHDRVQQKEVSAYWATPHEGDCRPSCISGFSFFSLLGKIIVNYNLDKLELLERRIIRKILIPRNTSGPESTVLINKDIGYDIKGSVCILRNFLIVCEFRVVSV